VNNVGSRKRGFTIVELLIVIVVIAIPAAITAVGYAGIRERAGEAAPQSELSGRARQLGV
jgi:prepilin-type N-terminal cleavage/methylation domain-containing protein